MAWSTPSHYLNQCWDIINWNLRNKLQCNFNQNCNIFIQENVFENVVCKMASILSRPQCVNSLWASDAILCWEVPCQGPIPWTIFYCNSNLMENWFYCNAIEGYHITTNFAHVTTAQLLCHMQNFIAITSLQHDWSRMKLHRIWIMMEKLFMKWALVWQKKHQWTLWLQSLIKYSQIDLIWNLSHVPNGKFI